MLWVFNKKNISNADEAINFIGQLSANGSESTEIIHQEILVCLGVSATAKVYQMRGSKKIIYLLTQSLMIAFSMRTIKSIKCRFEWKFYKTRAADAIYFDTWGRENLLKS